MGIDDHDTFTGLTPLQQACLDGNIEKVLELVDAGADVDIQANGEMAGKTAAMIAASEGSTDILKAMNRGPSLLNLKDADGSDEKALVGQLTRALNSLEGRVGNMSADELREQVAAAARAAQTAAKVAASPSGKSSKQMLAKVRADLRALEEIVKS